MPKVSIITPVYNVEKYIGRCIDSILLQTFPDFELLLIDDGSTDQSGKICDGYAGNDSRVRVFHRQNVGVSQTREFGIRQAVGDYIQFVDSDDWIEPIMLECMYECAQFNKAEIVGCNFIQEFYSASHPMRVVYTDKESFYREMIRGYWAVLWKLFISRSLFVENEIQFPPEFYRGEDYYACIQLFAFAKKVASVDKYLYHYSRMNPNSIITTDSLANLEIQIRLMNVVTSFLEKKGILQKYYLELSEAKFKTKLSLLKKDPLKWAEIFPECNFYYKFSQIPRREKWKCLFLIFINKLIIVIQNKRKI